MTNLIPLATSSIILLERGWTFSDKKDLSMVSICETLMTLSFGSLDCFVERRIFPGAAAKRKFDVMAMAMMVLILLSAPFET